MPSPPCCSTAATASDVTAASTNGSPRPGTARQPIEHAETSTAVTLAAGPLGRAWTPESWRGRRRCPGTTPRAGRLDPAARIRSRQQPEVRAEGDAERPDWAGHRFGSDQVVDDPTDVRDGVQQHVRGLQHRHGRLGIVPGYARRPCRRASGRATSTPRSASPAGPIHPVPAPTHPRRAQRQSTTAGDLGAIKPTETSASPDPTGPQSSPGAGGKAASRMEFCPVAWRIFGLHRTSSSVVRSVQ